MNSLQDPRIAATLQRLHRAARIDWLVFAKALPSVVAGAFMGRSAVDSATPHLKSAFIPIDPDQGLALYQFARMSKARRIVEFGCSFGVSAIYLAAAVRDNGGGEVVTTEIEPNKIRKAREHFDAAGVAREITLLEGDALKTLRRVDGPIDLLFLDGWKDLCLPVLRLLEERLAPGAAVFCDDMKRFRKTLKPYTDYVRDRDGAYVSLELPLGDGLEFSVRA